MYVIWNEKVEECFKVLFQHLPVRTDKTHYRFVSLFVCLFGVSLTTFMSNSDYRL
jgi:uncharacterized membrane protein YeiB